MRRLQIIVEAEQSILTARMPQGGNLVESLPYISGTATWGAFATRFVADRGGRLGGPDRARFDEAFYGDSMRFGNLYPCGVNFGPRRATLYPALPVPRSAFTCRALPGFRRDSHVPSRLYGVESAHGVTDGLLVDPPDGCGEPMCGARPQRHDGLYQVVERKASVTAGHEAGVVTTKPRWSYALHNAIEDATQMTQTGKLFAHRALERHQLFLGWIDVAEGFLADGLFPVTGEWLVVGRRRASQGAVRVLAVEPLEGVTDLWGKTVQERVVDSFPGSFTITLTSDAVIVDEWLQQHVGLEPLLKAWSERCGSTITLSRSFTAARLVPGWNGVDGRQRDSDLATVAGSCFRLDLNEGGPARVRDLLFEIEREGVGLRRNEGFGSLLVNDSFHRRLRELPGSAER